MAETQAKFLTGNLFGHVTIMSLTASLGLMAVFVVDFLDMLFISMLGEAELAAAIGYAGTVLFFTTSVGIGIAIASGALTARALGSGDEALARQRATNSLAMGVVLGIVFSALVFVTSPTLVGLLGATGHTADLAVHYLSIIVPTLPLLLLGMTGGAILRAHGDARRAMTATIAGGLVNTVLDPILIFVMGWDLTGAALASVAARVTIAVFGLLPVIRHYGGFVRPTLTSLAQDFRPIFAIGAPAILTQMATPVGQAYITRSMAEYGESAVAGMAITGRLVPVAFGVIFALSGAVGPIIGQNYGAQNQKRVIRALHDALLFTAIVILLVSAILFGLRGSIADLFQADGLARELVFLFCGPLALFWFFNGAIFVCNAAFNNIGHPIYSTWVNWGRHTIGTIPFAALGAWVWGAPGVLIGQAAGGVLFAALAYWLARRAMSECDPNVPHRPFQRQSRFIQLFHHRR